jgi:integrase
VGIIARKSSKKNGGVRYLVQVRIKGQTECKTFKSEADARAWQAKRQAQIYEGERVLEKRVKSAVLADIIHLYAEVVCPTRGKTVSDGGKYELTHLKYIGESFLADMKIVEIRPEHVETFIDQRRAARKRNGQPCVDSTIRRTFDVLSSVLQFAATTLPIHSYHNPCRFISKSKRPKPSRVRERNLRDGEFAEFRTQLSLYREGEFAAVYEFLLYSGFRRSEALLCRESWVNWHDHTIKLPISKCEDGQVRSLVPEVLELLRNLKTDDEGRYFPMLPDHLTKLTAKLSKRTSLMLSARQYEGGRYADAIQLWLLVPQMRIEELSTLRADRIDWDEGVFKFDNPQSTTLRRRVVPAEAMSLLRAMPTAKGRRYFDFTGEELRSALTACQEAAKRYGTFCTHILRAAFTTALGSTVQIQFVGAYTGHKDWRSILRYTRETKADIARRYAQQASAGLARFASPRKPLPESAHEFPGALA